MEKYAYTERVSEIVVNGVASEGPTKLPTFSGSFPTIPEIGALMME
jgi:hypothetical protein